jgi:hypothetical protein
MFDFNCFLINVWNLAYRENSEQQIQRAGAVKITVAESRAAISRERQLIPSVQQCR